MTFDKIIQNVYDKVINTLLVQLDETATVEMALVTATEVQGFITVSDGTVIQSSKITVGISIPMLQQLISQDVAVLKAQMIETAYKTATKELWGL